MLRVLDLGCGPGRDVKYFSDLGMQVTGLDGCKEFLDMCKQVRLWKEIGAPHSSHLHDAHFACDLISLLYHISVPALTFNRAAVSNICSVAAGSSRSPTSKRQLPRHLCQRGPLSRGSRHLHSFTG